MTERGTAVTAAAIPEERALRDSPGACIADERQELDDTQFAQTVTAVAGVFVAAGLGFGDVLAIMLPNRVELVTSMFAAWRLGAAVTPVNPSLTVQEARYQIDDAVALIVPGDASAQKLGGGRPIISEEVTSPPGTRPGTRKLGLVICGAAPMPRELIGEFEQRHGGRVAGEDVVPCSDVMRGSLRRPDESA